MSDKPFEVGEEVWVIGAGVSDPYRARIKTKHARTGHLRVEGSDWWFSSDGFIRGDSYRWSNMRIVRDGDGELLRHRRKAWLRAVDHAARQEFAQAVKALRKLLEQAEELKP